MIFSLFLSPTTLFDVMSYIYCLLFSHFIKSTVQFSEMPISICIAFKRTSWIPCVVLHSALLKCWVVNSVTRPEVKYGHRWWVPEKVLLFTRKPWWTLADFTYEEGSLSLLKQLLSSFFNYSRSLCRCAAVELSVSLIVKVTLIYMIVLFIWLNLFLPAAQWMLLQGQLAHYSTCIILCDFSMNIYQRCFTLLQLELF